MDNIGNVARVRGGTAMRSDKYDCLYYTPQVGKPLVCICLWPSAVLGLRLLRTSVITHLEEYEHFTFCHTLSGSCYVVINHD